MRFIYFFTTIFLTIAPQLLQAASRDTIKYIHTTTAPEVEGAYSQGVTFDMSEGKLIFVAGQVARDPKTGKINNENITAATSQTLDNIQKILRAAGSDLKYVMRTDVFLKDFKDWDAFDFEYAKHFAKGHYPARQTVAVGMENKIEISCIAFVPNRRA